jgi:RimJ/RimL family protein N-acetyltransferase
LRALFEGRVDWAAGEPALSSTSLWPQADRRVLGYRVAALELDPLAAPYLLHVILDDRGRLLGRIGCHEGPSRAGEVEIGYFVQETERGRGVAGEAVDQFLSWLRGKGVKRVRATVRPDNVPSLRLLKRRGFVEVGTRWDEEDGLELVFTLDMTG